MALRPDIILSGRPVDIMGAMERGQLAGQRQNEIQRRNALARFVDQNGAGIAAGEQNALAGYARFDPGAALGVEQTRLGMDSTRQQMRLREEANRRAQAASARAAEAMRVQLQNAKTAQEQAQLAAQAEKEIAQARKLLQMAQSAADRGDAAAIAQIGREFGIENATAAHIPDMTASVDGGFAAISEYRKAFPAQEAPELPAAAQTLEWRANEAGLQPGSPEYQSFIMNNGSQPSGMNLSVNPDGSMSFTQGEGVTQGIGSPASLNRATGSKDAEAIAKARDAANEADNLLQELSAAKSVLDSGLNTGLGAPLAATASAVGEAVGLTDGTTATQYQQLESASKKIAMDGLRLLGGNDTERELLTSMQTTVSANKTEEANRAILRKQRAAAQVLTERSAFMDRWVADNGSLANPSSGGMTFSEAWRAYQVPRFRELANAGQPPESGEMTFEQFSADPSAQAAAKKYGVTLEEMFAIRSGIDG